MTTKHWIHSYNDIPVSIDPDRYPSVTAILEQAMESFGERIAFRTLEESCSYRELDELSSNLAAYLQKVLGVDKGNRVAVMLPNVPAFPVTLVALAKIGAIQVNVNPLYTARELEHQLNDARAEVIVVASSSAATLAEIVEWTPVKKIVVANLDGQGAVDIPVDSLHPRIYGATSLKDAIEQGRLLECSPVDIHGDDILFLQYTGGTTGLSKGAALSHRNIVANIEQFKAVMGEAVRPGCDVIVTAIPLYHIFALTVNFLSYFSVGAENWLVANPRDAAKLIEVLRSARPTVFTGVNTLFAGLAAHPRINEVDWSRLRLSIGGGSATLQSTSERWQAVTGSFIREGYGLSETSPIVSFNPLHVTGFTGTTGLPLPSTDVKLLDDTGEEVPFGAAGEICVKGPQVMRGYWERPEENERAFTSDRYFRTGDIGVFDERGFLKIVDRKKDMIIVSGFNVYPNEVEAVVTAHPRVLECACVGVPDDKTGEAVKLFVVRAAGADLSHEELDGHCRAVLAAYKVPRHIQFVDALPKSTVGKILRRELREGV